jgi:hypothetical protein
MGLDMYLRKKTYVKNWDFTEEKDKYEITVKKGGEPAEDIKTDRISYITESVGYWRKANEIHRWFVENVQDGNDDCREYYVDKKQLQELLDICKTVKENRENAENLLPTQDGFFFGGTEYDDYYFEDIDNTIKILEDILNEDTKCSDYYYQSSW